MMNVGSRDPSPRRPAGDDGGIDFSRPRSEPTLEPPIPPIPPLPSQFKVPQTGQVPGSLVPQAHPGQARESRMDSEFMAGGIYDLYGSERDKDRDSWQSSVYSESGQPEVFEQARRSSNGTLGFGNPGGSGRYQTRPSQSSKLGQEVDLSDDREEVLDEDRDLRIRTGVDHSQERENEDGVEDEPGSPGSWEGVFSMLHTSDRDGSNRDSGDSRILSHSQRIPSSGAHSHMHSSTPPITLTPDKTSNTSLSHSIKHMNGQQNGNSRRTSALSASTSTSASTSLTPSSSRPGISKLSPLNASTGSGTATGGTGSTTGNDSMISFSGSSQYPGEENDSFYVRSTYARLDAEGVHGDGWDPGIERTRGGPNASKRNTVALPHKGGDVDPKERNYLSNLDRYGFVDEPLRNRSETRLALIPSAPLLKIPKLPNRSPIPPGVKEQPPPLSFGPSVDDAPGAKPPPSPRPENEESLRHRLKENERVGKWMKMMRVNKRDEGGNIREWGWRSEAQGQKLLKRVYKGIPDRWRMAAWYTLAEEKARDNKGKGRAPMDGDDLGDTYRHHIDLPSEHDVQIDLDVPRTISGHTLFVTRYGSGQRSLFHVLHSFSLLCDTCGYCQGMGPIAATLLCYFDPERAYALMVRLHDVYGMHSIFAPGFPGLLEAFYVQERLMEHLMPEVYKSFQRNMISSSAWGTKWYITLFVNTVPFSQQLRIWDALWMDGRDVVVIVSIAILWAFKDLLSDSRATFESILSLLSSFYVAEDEDVFMNWIRKVLHQPGLKARMDGWRHEWAGLVAEGKHHQALL